MEISRFSKEQLNKLDKEQLIELLTKQQEEAEKQQEQIDILTQELNQIRAMLFARKSEKQTEPDPDQLQMEFNEAESLSTNAAFEENEELTIQEHTRKVKKAGKRKADLSKLPKEIVTHSIDEEKLKEIFPDGYKKLPDEVYSNVEYQPAKYIVKEHHIEIYADKKDDRIVRADHPAELLRSSIATPSLVAGIMNGKYVNALPLYRIEQEYERNDVPISRQTMANWVIKTTERYLSLIYEHLKEKLLSHSVLHADETPVIVNKDGRPAGAKSSMWVYRSNVLDTEPVVIYEYQKTRKAEHPKEFLKGFTGVLVTDGYEVYHKLARERADEITVSGCWVHLKRKYTDAIKAMGKSGADTIAGTLAGHAIEMISKIFHIDNNLDHLDEKSRLKARKESIEPLVDEFFAWIRVHKNDVTRKSATGKAFSYSLEQEPYLREFLKNGNVPMDNNAAERAIRPFCIGKKNWVMCDTVNGAKDSAIVYSLTETAKANGLKPYEYLKHLLTEIPKNIDESDPSFLDELLPWSKDLPEECRSQG